MQIHRRTSAAKMPRPRRPLLWTALALALVVATACSPTSPSTPPAGSPGASAPATAGASPASAEPLEPAALTFWDPLVSAAAAASGAPKSEWFITKAIERFQSENPGITVELVQQSSEFPTQFRAASIARNGPDIVSLYPGGDISSYAQFLRPLDDVFTAADQEPLTGWELVRADLAPDGALLGVPFGAGQYFEVMYNKSLVPADFAPAETWEELLSTAAELKEGGVTPFVVGEAEGYSGAWILAKLVGAQIGTEGFLEMRAGARSIEDPAMIAGYEAYKRLLDEGLTNEDAASKTYGEAKQAFLNGEAAMFISGSWDFGEVVSVLGDNAGVMPIPGPEGSPHQDALPGAPSIAFAVTEYSEHQEAAIRFLKFMLQADVLDSYVEITQAEASNHRDASPDRITNPLLKAQAEWLTTRDIIIPFDNILQAEVNAEFYRLNSAVFAGRTSPADAVKTLETTRASVAD